MIQQRGLAPSRSQAHPVIIAGVLVGILDILAASSSGIGSPVRRRSGCFRVLRAVFWALFVGLPIALTVTRSSRAQAFRRGESATPHQ
jgi:hypothetical protein